jgi:hypothetical protein
MMLGYCTAFGKDPLLDLPVRIGVFPPAVEDDFEIRSTTIALGSADHRQLVRIIYCPEV